MAQLEYDRNPSISAFISCLSFSLSRTLPSSSPAASAHTRIWGCTSRGSGQYIIILFASLCCSICMPSVVANNSSSSTPTPHFNCLSVCPSVRQGYPGLFICILCTYIRMSTVLYAHCIYVRFAFSARVVLEVRTTMVGHWYVSSGWLLGVRDLFIRASFAPLDGRVLYHQRFELMRSTCFVAG